MRIALSIILLATGTALSMEIIVSEARRTEMSAAVFSGIVTNVQHLPLRTTNAVPRGILFGRDGSDRGLWRADVVIGSVIKQDVPLGTVAAVYYEQRPDPPSFSMRVCPGYPVVETNMHATFWCYRMTNDVLTNVLSVSTPSSVKGNDQGA